MVLFSLVVPSPSRLHPHLLRETLATEMNASSPSKCPAAPLPGRPGGQTPVRWGVQAPVLTAAAAKDPRVPPAFSSRWECFEAAGIQGKSPHRPPRSSPSDGAGGGDPQGHLCG